MSYKPVLCCVCRSRPQLKNLLVVNRTKTAKPDTWRENPHLMMMSSCTWVHWVTHWGRPPKTIPYVRLPVDWFPRPQLTLVVNRTGFGQPLPTMHQPHDIVFIKVKLQLLEFTERFKCPFIPAKVV